jgi:hypothetical protein
MLKHNKLEYSSLTSNFQFRLVIAGKIRQVPIDWVSLLQTRLKMLARIATIANSKVVGASVCPWQAFPT